ncbi:hypothetical protein BD626DRAFT_513322 [Schizophyllum amplum]|uniref:F-box domain-containing protein n=1 Tax=Schizophyllum amplum TaxID=97359 RepID=A0A550BZD9_9AGAR|nr:hypothetical protein BD626DRAFT_513322 [Auriculariopsis ampla]
MITLTDLPPELLIDIIEYSILGNNNTAALLRIHSTISAPARHIIHSRLRFTSVTQLARFAHVPGNIELSCAPQSIILDLAGGASRQVFQLLRCCFLRCTAMRHAQRGADGRLLLDSIRLRLHSHTFDKHKNVFDALTLVDPCTFVWTGPDPPHHFSTAIVSGATVQLFRALETYTRLEGLTLANVAFPSPRGASLPEAPFTLPYVPTLRRMRIGQAVFLGPQEVARFALRYVAQTGEETVEQAIKLEKIRLVDVYKESIWGWRLRRGEVVEAAMAMWKEAHGGLPHEPSSDVESTEARAVRNDLMSLVSCEAQTERIVGGDRAESTECGFLF